MRLFGTMQARGKSKAAELVVECLLRQKSKAGQFASNPTSVSHELVGRAQNSTPGVLNEKPELHPHRLSIAASALAIGIGLFEGAKQDRSAIALCLGKVLLAINSNRGLYQLNTIDFQLLDGATASYEKYLQESGQRINEADVAELLERPGWPTWAEWYEEYKLWAAIENPQLRENRDGKSFIDFMDHTTLKLAFRSGKDPRFFAREFAAQFDINTFLL